MGLGALLVEPAGVAFARAAVEPAAHRPGRVALPLLQEPQVEARDLPVQEQPAGGHPGLVLGLHRADPTFQHPAGVPGVLPEVDPVPGAAPGIEARQGVHQAVEVVGLGDAAVGAGEVQHGQVPLTRDVRRGCLVDAGGIGACLDPVGRHRVPGEQDVPAVLPPSPAAGRPAGRQEQPDHHPRMPHVLPPSPRGIPGSEDGTIWHFVSECIRQPGETARIGAGDRCLASTGRGRTGGTSMGIPARRRDSSFAGEDP
jgi:hypothetical protein